MHQSPLIQAIIFELHIPALDRKEDIEGPGNQQPYHRGLFLGNGFHDPLGLNALENDASGADNKISKPVHFGAGVIQRRQAKEVVPMGLFVVHIFQETGKFKIPMGQKCCFWGASGSGRKVQCCIIGNLDIDLWIRGRDVFKNVLIRFCKSGFEFFRTDKYISFNEKIQIIFYVRNALNKFFTENKDLGFCDMRTTLNGFCRKPEVKGNGPCPGSEDSKINGEPLETIRHQLDNPVPFPDSPGNKPLGELIGLVVEFFPGDFPSSIFFRLSFDYCGFSPIYAGITGEYLCDQHTFFLKPLQNLPFCPISASGSNFNPRNTPCIPVVKIFAFLELEPRLNVKCGFNRAGKNEYFSKVSSFQRIHLKA